MKSIQVSERIITNTYEKLDNIPHYESNMYYKDGKVYKIYNKMFRMFRYKNMYLLTDNKFINACNIIEGLFQGDKFIGVSMDYLKDFKTLYNILIDLDLYQVKLIFEYILDFYTDALNKNFLYWDIHLNNMGFSKEKFYIVDIDSMQYKPSKIHKKYAINSLLCMFYEMCLKTKIRNNYINYKDIIFYMCERESYLNNNMTIDELKEIINNTSEDEIKEKKLLLY